LILSGVFFTACSAQHDNTSNTGTLADTVIKNARIYTMDAQQPWAETLAIYQGRIVYVGDEAGLADYTRTDTHVIDVGGKMVMPGLVDAHLHPTRGGIKRLYECSFPFSATPDDILKTVAQCVKDQPDAVWIRGGQWNSGFFDIYDIASPREFLDAVSGDAAVFLNDDSNHNGWVNSKALELAGITKDTPDPSDGTYVRDPVTGAPNGLLLEGAEQSLFDSLPDWSSKQYQASVVEVVHVANRFGITALKDANATPADMAAYQSVDQRGGLHAHMSTSIKTPYGHREDVLDYDAIDALRDRYKSPHVHTASVKLYMDGVPTSSRTAAMLAPYTLANLKDTPTRGKLHVEPELVTRDIVELDKRGYTIKIHAAGDRSVRVSLDAIEAARKANGDSGLRHEIAHAGYIDPADIPRFLALGAVADLSPYLWHPSPIIDSVVGAVGSPRGEHYWPNKDLLDARAPILAGSDWPAAVASMDPWVGIEALVTRADPRTNSTNTLWPEQAISLAQALHIFTIDGAKALRMHSEIGSLEVGKSADLIVLSENLFDLEPSAISDIKIIKTFFEGNVVYDMSESGEE
jgi:predicted amidohydrolase YtcJ